MIVSGKNNDYDKSPMNTPDIEKLVSQIMQSLPAGLQDMKQDVDQQLRAALQHSLSRMNLVTRDEFDVQREVLSRTRAKLETLEQQVAALEQQLSNKPKPD